MATCANQLLYKSRQPLAINILSQAGRDLPSDSTFGVAGIPVLLYPIVHLILYESE